MTAATALILLVAGALAMGLSPVLVRHAGTGPFASAFWRLSLSLPILFVWARATRTVPAGPDAARARLRAVGLAGLFFGGDITLWHLAILHTSIANATFFACLAPVWVALLSPALLKEKVARTTLAGLGICLIGAGVLILQSSAGTGGRWLGDLYALATSVFFGLYFLAVRAARRHMSAGEITYASTLVSAAVALAVVLVSGETLLPDSGTGAANLLALGLLSHAGGQGFLSIALGVLSASFSSLVIFIEAVAAALFAWAFAGETPTGLQVVGGMAILFGIFVARPRSARAAR